MHKNKFYSDFSKKELIDGKCFMLSQIEQVPLKYQSQLISLFYYYWHLFEKCKFKVDGATFVDEQKECFFNLWWFIHDGRNSEGYVGNKVDEEMLSIMILTDVPPIHFKQVIPLIRLTWFNKIRHILKFTYKWKNPDNLILLS